MKIPVALTMLASPFSLPHNERWVLPIALGFFTLLTVYFTWRLKTDEGDKWLFRKKMKVSALFWLACEVLWQFHGAQAPRHVHRLDVGERPASPRLRNCG